VAAARKMACTVWKVLSAKVPYVEEVKPLMERKTREVERKAKKEVPDAASIGSDMESLAGNISKSRHTDTLARYADDMEEVFGGSREDIEKEDER
jgi:hypothetical protein